MLCWRLKCLWCHMTADRKALKELVYLSNINSSFLQATAYATQTYSTKTHSKEGPLVLIYWTAWNNRFYWFFIFHCILSLRWANLLSVYMSLFSSLKLVSFTTFLLLVTVFWKIHKHFDNYCCSDQVIIFHLGNYLPSSEQFLHIHLFHT